MSFQNIVLVKSGIFNIHRMVITILKTAFVKLNPKEWSIDTITGTNFDWDKFNRELERIINEHSYLIREYDFFQKTYLIALNKYAQIKRKTKNFVCYMFQRNSKKGNNETNKAGNQMLKE